MERALSARPGEAAGGPKNYRFDPHQIEVLVDAALRLVRAPGDGDALTATMRDLSQLADRAVIRARQVQGDVPALAALQVMEPLWLVARTSPLHRHGLEVAGSAARREFVRLAPQAGLTDIDVYAAMGEQSPVRSWPDVVRLSDERIRAGAIADEVVQLRLAKATLTTDLRRTTSALALAQTRLIFAKHRAGTAPAPPSEVPEVTRLPVLEQQAEVRVLRPKT